MADSIRLLMMITSFLTASLRQVTASCASLLKCIAGHDTLLVMTGTARYASSFVDPRCSLRMAPGYACD